MPRHTFLAPLPCTSNVYMFTPYTPPSMIEKQIKELGWEIDEWAFMDNPDNPAIFYLVKRSQSASCPIY